MVVFTGIAVITVATGGAGAIAGAGIGLSAGTAAATAGTATAIGTAAGVGTAGGAIAGAGAGALAGAAGGGSLAGAAAGAIAGGSAAVGVGGAGAGAGAGAGKKGDSATSYLYHYRYYVQKNGNKGGYINRTGWTNHGALAAGALSGPVGWLAVGATENADGGQATYDCWKPVVHDISEELSKGMALRDLVSHQNIADVTITHNNPTGLPHIILENIWNEKFEIEYLVIQDTGKCVCHAKPVFI